MTDLPPALRARFVQRVRDFGQTLERETDVDQLARLAHQLAGTAASFGFSELGDAAARFEAAVKRNPANVAVARRGLLHQCQRIAELDQ